MRTITLDLPLPHKTLHPNARSHWRVKAKAVKDTRQMAFAVGKSKMLELKDSKPLSAAVMHVTFYVGGLHDDDNLWAWLKAVRDGLQDAGVVENDRDLQQGSLLQVVDPKRSGNRGLVIVVDERIAVAAFARRVR